MTYCAWPSCGARTVEEGDWTGLCSEPRRRIGTIRQVLSANGLWFTGRLHGTEVAFERSLGELGVQLINAAPTSSRRSASSSASTERWKEWLFDEGPAEDLPHLQELLDASPHHYNTERPHQGIGDLTPSERFDGQPIPDRTRQPHSTPDAE